MGTIDEPPVVPEVLSRLFTAVFRSEQRGDDVCWNRHDRSWLIRSPWGPGFVAQEPPRLVGSGDFSFMMRVHFPSTEDILTGVRLAENLSKNRYCAHCGDPRIQFHAVLPDVYGDLVLRCLLRPDPGAVSSFGGNGQAKHLGSPFGCSSVRGGPIHRQDDYLEVGHYRYGEPLTTMEAIDRRWCSRCAGTAANVWNNQSESLRQVLGREPSTEEVRAAVRELEQGR